MYHSKVVSKIIVDNNIRVFAEVGVWKSHFTRSVLRSEANTILEQYWAIDQWKQLGKEHGHMSTRSIEDWDSLYTKACRYMPYFKQLRVLRMESEDASNMFSHRYFPFGYFDMVYIDASHFYKDVKRDIQLWLPKVKKGGILGGHDYAEGRFIGVKTAVNEFFGSENISTFDDSVWCVNV